MGLSIVFEQVRNLQGTAEVQSTDEPGTSILLSVPWWALTQHLLLVRCAGQTFGIPFHGIERVLRVKTSALETQEGQPMVRLADGFVPLASLAALLGVEETRKAEGKLHVVILRSRQQRIAALVDDFVTQKEGLVQDVPLPSSDRTKVAGAIVLEDGSVAIVLHPSDLVASFASSVHTASLSYLSAPIEKREPPKILVVDDSITTRSLEKGILEVHGYRVQTAVDGEEALATLRREKVDLVITDVQMPRMDGFQLLEAIRKDSSMASLPVIVVTSVENEEEQKRGLSLGADAYIVKRKFDQRDLLDTIRQIL
jgi:two-component system chemotaxis sensor kinase CheA